MHVDILLEEDAEGFLDDLLDPRYLGPGTHTDWQVVQNVITEGIYTITITWAPTDPGHENKSISGVGAWFRGDYDYVADSASGITDDYPDYEPWPFQTQQYRGGTAFVWEWTGNNKPWFGKNTDVYTRTLTFEFTPVEIPSVHFSWAIPTPDIGVVISDATFGTYKVTATATDEQTKVIAHTFRDTVGNVAIITWEISQ